MRVYMDNSATSFPKPQSVVDAMVDYMTRGGTNVSRSVSAQAAGAADKIFTLREVLADFFNAPSSRSVVFTKNITEALNIIIKGFVRAGDAVMISSLEHNAVTRPLVQQGARIVAIPVSDKGLLDIDFVNNHISSVKAVICTHASNVSGDILPIEKIAEICKIYHKPFILDSAQSAGVLPIDMQSLSLAALCFTGHKALLGPSGTGGMIIDEAFAEQIPSYTTGGTGSKSHEEIHPRLLPDKYEAGTPNIVGLIGLLAGVESILDMGMQNRLKHEREMAQYFFEKIASLKNVRVIGSTDYSKKLPVFSLDFDGIDNAAASYLLADTFGIDNRPGLHCAPRAHQVYGTYPRGTVRLSLSHYTTASEIDYAFDALKNIR